jgi:hypothetical protein
MVCVASFDSSAPRLELQLRPVVLWCSVLVLLLCSGCSLLRGRETYIIDTAACALKCAIEQARADGREDVAEALERIQEQRAAAGACGAPAKSP